MTQRFSIRWWMLLFFYGGASLSPSFLLSQLAQQVLQTAAEGYGRVLLAQFTEEGASTVTEEKAQLSVSTRKVIELSQFHGSRQD